MKNIVISILVGLFTITASTAATEKYDTFTIPFKQSWSGDKVIIEIPSYPMSYGDDTEFPEPGTYILNKPEVLKREIERTGRYQVISTFVVNTTLIVGFWIIVLLIILILRVVHLNKKITY